MASSSAEKIGYIASLALILAFDSGLTGYTVVGDGAPLIMFPKVDAYMWEKVNLLTWYLTTAAEVQLVLSLCICSWFPCIDELRNTPRFIWLVCRSVLGFLGCMGVFGDVDDEKSFLGGWQIFVDSYYVFLVHTLLIILVDYVHGKAEMVWRDEVEPVNIPRIVVSSPRNVHRMDSEREIQAGYLSADDV